MKKNIFAGALLLIASVAHSQTVIPPGDFHGGDLIMAAGQSLTGGHYYNIGRFVIPSGRSTPIVRNSGVVRITANEISIAGVLNGNFAGSPGGLQASCAGANGGITGAGPGGGTGGAYGPDVHGNGGAGGGYGGGGGNSGNALVNLPPLPGAGGLSYGDISRNSIEPGSGGGSGSNYFNCQAIGGRGGAGGGGIHLESPNILITGQVNARGENGFTGSPQVSGGAHASGGAGSGGGVLLIGAGTIAGLIDVNGGNGGNSPNVAFAIGGGGGGGGRIKMYGSFNTTSAVLRANGGNAGSSFAAAASPSRAGQIGTITIVSDAQTIATGAIELSVYCAGTENVSIPFTTSGTFGASNIFTAQLSNREGNFSAPVNIGTSTGSGSIIAVIPASTASGGGYRIRVVSSDPIITGADNGADLTIRALPAASVSGSSSVCPNSSATISVALTGVPPWSGVYSDGVNNIPFVANASPFTVDVIPSETTTYSLVSVSDTYCSGSVSGSATITVSDNEPPVPNVAELPLITAECDATVSAPTATDNCKGQVIATTEGATTFNVQGTFTIHWTYADDNGNSVTQQQTVIIDDVTSPVLDAPLTDVATQCSVTISTIPMAADNCAGSITATTEDPLTYDAEGTYVIHWKFDDGNGNVLEANQTVIVDDTEAPVLDAPLTDVVAQCSVTISTIPMATDNCAGSITATTEDPLTYDAEGTYVIHWKFDDGNGNVLEANQTVIVDDTEAPVLDAPLTDVVAQCSVIISTIPMATDNCAGSITATTEDPLTYDAEGTYVIHWKFDDGNGNVLEANQTVVINDTEAPVLDAPVPDISAECDATITTVPTATDNCAGTITGTTEDPLTYNNQGTYMIHWKFSDGNGNETEVIQTVVIDDTQAPVPALVALPDITAACAVAVSTTPVANDNCAGEIQGTTTDPLSYTVPGSYTITWTFDDGNGNTTQQAQNVSVADDVAPVIPDLVFEIGAGPTAGTCGRTVTFDDPTATDNCTLVRFERTDGTGLVSGDVFPAGTTVISYEAEDAAGNITEASFSIEIAPNALPVITTVTGPVGAKPVNAVITITAQFTDDNAQAASINWGDGSTTNAILTSTSFSGQHRYVDAGTYTVEVQLTDACGQVATSSLVVMVYDQNAGHVTGAGLFNSPRDAYRGDRNASCVAAFEFNIKYKNNSTVPEGKLEFRLLLANLRFKSTSYEWLVVDDDLAVFKGKGDLNGQRGYNFLVSAVDVHRGGTDDRWNFLFDKFRIKIWNAAGVVIYDNEQGAADFAEPTTPILGAIVIHKAKKRNSGVALRTETAPLGEEFATETEVTVFPNPFVDMITIQLDPKTKVNPHIQLFDSSGKPVYGQEHPYQDSGTYSINLGNAASKGGLYLLKVGQGKRVAVIKVFAGAK